MAVFRKGVPERMAGLVYSMDDGIVADADYGSELNRVRELTGRHCPDCDHQAVKHVMES